MAWKLGDRLIHRFNPDLGPGMIQEVDGRTLVVQFPDSESVLRLSADSDAITPLAYLAAVAAALRGKFPPGTEGETN